MGLFLMQSTTKVEVLTGPVESGYNPFGDGVEFDRHVAAVEQASACLAQSVQWVYRHSRTAAIAAGVAFAGMIVIANSSADLRSIRGKALEMSFGLVGLGVLSYVAYQYIKDESNHANRD
jgi:hypothetical protein